MAEADDILAEGRKQFQLCADAEADNRETGKKDLEFARAGKQWPADIETQRTAEGRPVLTINKLPAYIRQVVNDARQNKPTIKVHPVDSNADPDTADIINGLIRNIETTSNADVAYDTATECAVANGFGYIRIGLDYAYDDSFDMDLQINRVINPFSVYGDPNSTAADSSDWDVAFVTDRLGKEQFKREYGDKAEVDWDDIDAWGDAHWREGETVLVAEWWSREKVDEEIVMLSNGLVVPAKDLTEKPQLAALLQAGAIQVKGQRTSKTCKVTQRIMSGAEVLETRDWPGKYIPIVPVYGEEFDIEGKRYFRSLIHNAIDAQRMFNYWRTTGTELVALAPRVPYIGPEGAFSVDDGWNTVNTVSHPYLEYSKDAVAPPARQPLDTGAAAGALQEALNASDDMKAIIGLYDASLGARSNETSGKAIIARQREGDVSTFHFIDNMARAIRHTGRILLDLIPHVYNTERIIRVVGEDGEEEARQINKPTQKIDPRTKQPMMEQGPDGRMQAMMAIHDLRVGKYDLVVSTGPNFTTRRQEAAEAMTEMLRAFPQAAPVIGPRLAKNLDWPEADDIAEELKEMAGGQVPPQVQKMIEEGKAKIAEQEQTIQQLQQDRSLDEAKLAADIKQAEVEAANNVRIAMIEIEADKQIAVYKADAEKEVAEYKAGLQAKVAAVAAANRPAPQQAA